MVLVALYGTGMVTAGRGFALPIFDGLGFGPTARLDVKGVEYSLFAFGVLGAVIIGWMSLMYFVLELAAHENAGVRASARKALIASTAVWFTFDTGFSIVTGELEHAAFNLPFLGLLAVPLYTMSTSDNGQEKKGQ